ncbi:MAG: leucine-rich repeat domain-containing protein [Oscillospiraceae bacterium]|nr:leucine-rich repeat domain-containing protein [Oscillospiraceae bacterium]MBR7084635.1 leucine-rich repeat domain-containing protein [Oscillospiraceae bacterium]
MKLLKKLFALSLAVTLLQNISFCPVQTAFAEGIPAVETEDLPHSGTCGENVTWEFDETSGLLTVSGTGTMDSAPWGGLPLKTVEIQEGVTSIADYAFYFQGGLTSVTIPEGVTRIGSFAFSVCSSLEAPVFPQSLKYIGGSAFAGCGAFTSVTLPEGLEIISGSAFTDCALLEEIQIPDSVSVMGASVFARTPLFENQSGIKYADGWVIGCDETVTSAILPDGTKGICPMAFMNCSELSEISIPDSVKYIGLMAFDGCISLPKENIGGITYIDNWAVSAQSELSPSMVLDKHTRGLAANLFYGCTFRTMDIPASVKYINPEAFSTCLNLESVIIRNPDCVIDMTDDYSRTISNLAKTVTEYYFTGILYGEENSTAQAYAEKYDITFKPISELPSEPDPCDLNHDGVVNAQDAGFILMYAAEVGAGNFTGTVAEYILTLSQ